MELTFVAIEIFEEFHEKIREAAGDMDQGTFFANPQPGSYRETLIYY